MASCHRTFFDLSNNTLDDLEFISPEALLDAVRVSWMAIQALERDQEYKNEFVREPFLTGHGIYPHGKAKEDMIPWDYFKVFVDGHKSLIDIAEKAGVFITAFDDVAEAFLDKRVGRHTLTDPYQRLFLFKSWHVPLFSLEKECKADAL